MKGILYIIATPIGNLEDISLRAIKLLGQVDLVLAEDTRVSGKLLKSLEISKKTISFHHYSGINKKRHIADYLESGMKIALLTDAGTPGISDPGNELIDFLQNYNTEVIPVPGASAVTTALSVSGFNASKYLFLGFLPKKKLSKTIKLLTLTTITSVYFDSPHRAIKNLQKILLQIGNREVFVGRELTKLNETHYRGTISEVIKSLQDEPNLKGEITVVVSPTGIEPVSSP